MPLAQPLALREADALGVGSGVREEEALTDAEARANVGVAPPEGVAAPVDVAARAEPLAQLDALGELEGVVQAVAEIEAALLALLQPTPLLGLPVEVLEPLREAQGEAEAQGDGVELS